MTEEAKHMTEEAKQKKKNQQQRGYTLVEMVMSIVLMAIIAGIFVSTIIEGSRTYVFIESQNEASFTAKFALKRILMDIRNASRIYSADATNIAFENGRFVIPKSMDTVYTSTDGISWSEHETGIAGSSHLTDIAYGNNNFVVVGYQGTIMTSPTGTDSWTLQDSGVSSTLWNITYGNGIYIVVGASGTVLKSSDAENWHAENQARLLWVEEQLQEVSPELRQLIDYRYRLGWTLRQIGERLGMKAGRVDGRIRRYLQQLRVKAEETYD